MKLIWLILQDPVARTCHQQRNVRDTTCAPQCIRMQPFSKLSQLLIMSCSHKNLKRFSSYHVDEHTHTHTHADISENNTVVATLSLRQW